MADGIPARLTVAEGRKFGLTVGVAFVVLGLALLWRSRPLRAEIVMLVGALFIAAALIAPTRLGPVERAWMGLAHAISKVTTPVFMAVVYFIVLTPVGLVRRWSGKQAMLRGRPGASRWETHESASDPARMERQF